MSILWSLPKVYDTSALNLKKKLVSSYWSELIGAETKALNDHGKLSHSPYNP